MIGHQLDHLVAIAARPDVTIQILPFSAGAHPALAGAFVHLEFPAISDPNVIFIENTLGDTLLRDASDLIAAYREQFWQIGRPREQPGRTRALRERCQERKRCVA
jgi:hypothetical protein